MKRMFHESRVRAAVTHALTVVAMSSVFSVAGVLPVASAAETATSTQRKIAFDIPAGPLSRVLNQLAEAGEVQFLYSSELADGISSAGLRGSFTVREAVAAILSGTGLSHRFTDARTVTIDKARSSRVLGPVRVEGAQASPVSGVNGSRDVTATEGTGSFTTGAMTIGSKAPRSIKDTPQSVSVITSERLEQQNIGDFTEALNQAPGVTLVSGGASGTSSNLETTFYSRGFEITSIQVDGGAPLTTRFPTSASAYFPQIDLSQYDHVEVLRGAAGLFNGYGDPSGTINLVRKKPLDHEQVTLNAEWGSWNHYRTVLDATAPLALDGKLRGRMVVTWQSNEYFYQIAEDQKTLLYGVLSYVLTPTTLVTAGMSQSSQDSIPWYRGLPRYQTGEDLGLPRDTGLLFPWNRWNFDTTEMFGSIEQQLGADWTAKINLTHNNQESTRKIGYADGAVNPIDNRGPRLYGSYNDYASEQLSMEATLSGAFTLFGQRQEVTMGVNRSDQDGGGRTEYSSLITSSATAPYQPYPGGPRYCTTTSVCPTGIASPPIDVFAFDPFDRLYTEPATALPSVSYPELGQVQSLAYLNLRLTAFDRLHLETGLRWSRYEYKYASNFLCTSIPTSGTPSATNCVGREIGDAYRPERNSYRGDAISWPPSVALSYDVTASLVSYLGYTDIYEDQSNRLDGDLESLDPVQGANVELGLKWSLRDGRLNAALAVYRIEKQGFAQQEPGFTSRYKRNPDGSLFLNENSQIVVIANDGTELPNGRTDLYHACCFIQRQDQTQVSEGVDAELSGEVLPGWQVSAGYTFSRNERKGGGYSSNEEGVPFLSIQPEHLYKLWTSYDFGGSGATGWLSNLTVSGGVNGQSEGYRSGQTCPDGKVGEPNPLTGIAPCLVSLVPYEFTVEPYAVVSGRIDYRLNERWSAALNLKNILDETYYAAVGGVGGGNWYGEPRSFTLTVRGRF